MTRLLEPIVTARVLVVVAHPDDETIGGGALLLRTIDASVVVITDGAPRDRNLWPAGETAASREEYAQRRREELRRAMEEAGVSLERIHVFEIPDCDAVRQIPAIVRRLAKLMDTLQPDIVLTHAYEGAHVDHDATALCVHAAMHLSGRGHPHEMALYHGDGGKIVAHEFLPGTAPGETMTLDDRLRARKTGMLAHYASQQQYADYFGTEIERYRCAPRYDFANPPAAGTLLYEHSGAGITAAEWRAQARAGLETLDLGDGLNRDPRSVAAAAAARAGAPLVSIVVRTIGRDTLTESLASIRSQTYPNIEVVLVDVSGGGPPSSWQDRPGLILKVRAAHGCDRGRAANAGLEAATGTYISFLDDDDWLHPDHVEALVNTLEAAPAARVAYAGVEAVEWIDRAPVRRWVFDAPYDPVALLCENFIPLNGVLLDRALVDDGVRFDETLSIYEDWDFLIALSRRTAFVKSTGVTAVYRWPRGSGVGDPSQTGASQEQVYAKWRRAPSDEEHVALMRRAIAQTTLNDARRTQLEELQRHLHAQDAELAWLRSHTAAQARQLDELRAHLQGQDDELDRLRPTVSAQEQQLQELRPHLSLQDYELATLRSRLESLVTDLRQLESRAAAAEARLTTMLGSNSWRLTRPLRALRAWVSGFGTVARTPPRKR